MSQNERDTLLQLFVWLIEAGYKRDSKEIELILKQLRGSDVGTAAERVAAQAQAFWKLLQKMKDDGK